MSQNPAPPSARYTVGVCSKLLKATLEAAEFIIVWLKSLKNRNASIIVQSALNLPLQRKVYGAPPACWNFCESQHHWGAWLIGRYRSRGWEEIHSPVLHLSSLWVCVPSSESEGHDKSDLKPAWLSPTSECAALWTDWQMTHVCSL